MELTPNKITVIILALSSRIDELNDRVAHFEKMVANGDEGSLERLERSKKHLDDAITLLKEVEEM